MKQPTHQEMTVEHEGKTYSATYWIERSIVTVSSFYLGQKSAQLGGMTALALAQLLLHELIAKSLRSPSNR